MIDDYGIYGSIINEQYSDIQQWVIIPTAMQNPSGSFTKKCWICPDDCYGALVSKWSASRLPHEKKVVVKAIPH